MWNLRIWHGAAHLCWVPQGSAQPPRHSQHLFQDKIGLIYIHIADHSRTHLCASSYILHLKERCFYIEVTLSDLTVSKRLFASFAPVLIFNNKNAVRNVSWPCSCWVNWEPNSCVPCLCAATIHLYIYMIGCVWSNIISIFRTPLIFILDSKAAAIIPKN